MQIFKNKRNVILSYVVMTFGILTYTFSWSVFMLPCQIISGGVTGLSSTLYYLLPWHIPVGVTNLVFNAIFFVLGLKILGSKFGINTIYGIVMSSVCFILWQQVLHIEQVIDAMVLVNNDFLCAVLGGALCGLGIGITFSMGGNSGGTDIIALIVCKYYNISPGKVLMLIDLVIIGCTFFVSHSINKVIYGYMVMVATTYVLDLVIDGNKQSYQIMVFSSKAPEIGLEIIREVGRGATLLDGEGVYSHQSQKVLLLLVHKTDKPHVMRIVHRIDENAFVSVSKTQGVFGKNFEKLKM
ncbi:MAG: YitT family protein [Bacteroidales bacterium]|nr:YitT family protein [Candidatus Colimorpha onthohippi]